MQHQAELSLVPGAVALPGAIHRKYPRAPYEWIWQGAFSATGTYTAPESQQVRRHHLHESVIQRAVRQAYTQVLNRGAGGVRSPLDH